MTIIFIESENLGVLDANVRHMTQVEFGKRNRQREYARTARILRDLRLIPKGPVVIGLAYGCNANGQLGLWVVLESPQHELAQMPGEGGKETHE